MLSFHAFGHPNITATHRKTFEFTKDSFATKTGDCIIGVNSDFSLSELREFIKKSDDRKVKIIVEADGLKEEITAELNPDFNSDHEIVARKGDFVSDRTLAVKADKACSDFGREFVEKLKNPEQKIIIKII